MVYQYHTIQQQHRHHHWRRNLRKKSPPQWTRCLQPSRSSCARSARCWSLQKPRSHPTHEEPDHGRDDGGGRDDEDGGDDVDGDGDSDDEDMVKRMSVCNVLSSFLFMFRPGCNLQGEVQASFGLISVAGPRSIGTCLNTFAITNMSDYVFDHKYVWTHFWWKIWIHIYMSEYIFYHKCLNIDYKIHSQTDWYGICMRIMSKNDHLHRYFSSRAPLHMMVMAT